MKSFIKEFKNEYAEKHLNLKLGKRELEPPLYEFILDVLDSIGKTGFSEIVSWKHITDESQIDMSEFNVTRKNSSKTKAKKKDDDVIHIALGRSEDEDGNPVYDWIDTDEPKSRAKKERKIVNIDYDRATLLMVRMRVQVKDDVAFVVVKLLLPKEDENGYMCLKSKSIYILYQMVNRSTYVTKNSVTLKGMMPLCINRQVSVIEDTKGNVYKLPMFRIKVFNKEFNPILLFAAKVGFYGAVDMFDCSYVIKLATADEPEEEGWTYFVITNTLTNKKTKDSKLRLKVPTEFLEKYSFMRSMTAMCYHALCDFNRPDKENIASYSLWMDELGYLYTGDRTTSRDIAKSTLLFWERLVDRTNQKTLCMYDFNKKNVYNLTTTIIQNFNSFKMKDNNDISSRRLRLNECIGALFSLRIGTSVNRILSKGEKVTLNDVVGIFKLAPNLIFRLLYKSPLITYNDIVNDMTFFNAYKFSIRGPNSLARKNERKITARDRGVSITSIGVVDADVCSSSSPGLKFGHISLIAGRAC